MAVKMIGVNACEVFGACLAQAGASVSAVITIVIIGHVAWGNLPHLSDLMTHLTSFASLCKEKRNHHLTGLS